MSFKQFNEHETHHFTYELIFKQLVSYLLRKTDIRLLYYRLPVLHCRLPTPQFYGSHCNPDLELRIFLLIYYRLAEGPNVARGKNRILLPIYPLVTTKNVSPFGPAVWPAIGNIYMTVLFYYR